MKCNCPRIYPCRTPEVTVCKVDISPVQHWVQFCRSDLKNNSSPSQTNLQCNLQCNVTRYDNSQYQKLYEYLERLLNSSHLCSYSATSYFSTNSISTGSL